MQNFNTDIQDAEFLTSAHPDHGTYIMIICISYTTLTYSKNLFHVPQFTALSKSYL